MSVNDAYQRQLLLVEPDSLFRRTVAAVARELQLAQIQEATSLEGAERLLKASRFDAMVIALDPAGQALQLVTRLRAGKSRCECSLPIVVLADGCDASTVLLLKQLTVRRVLLKPFKVKLVLESIVGLLEGAEV